MRTTSFLVPFLAALAVALLWPTVANAQRHPARGTPVHVVAPQPTVTVAWGHYSNFDMARERLGSLESMLLDLDARAQAVLDVSAMGDIGRARVELQQADWVLRTRGRVDDFERHVDRAERQLRSAERSVVSEERAMRRVQSDAARAVAALGSIRVDRVSPWVASRIQQAERRLHDGDRHARRGNLIQARHAWQDAIDAALDAEREASRTVWASHATWEAEPVWDDRGSRREGRRGRGRR